ncbi:MULTISPECIES: hypothetical protein [unclassified Leifsonia]|uniref:hypothetical protein n=1 Tax=unclassified Leifsonia TaxID=2663824 RepID=UPI0006FA3390|nr:MULTISPECIES: hypothetical protein [unclassified Leifsonia]KQX07175.1 hypothetical protein ASC59_05100 [Leifsonia sp. Root1293]KRA11458.1 hypothetical protein ASD61_05100 [Leifsonia sp. Root60]
MRFVLAIAAFFVAAVMIAFGIAQRTVLLEPSSIELAVTTQDGDPYSVIDASALLAHPGAQTVKVSGSGPVMMALGRAADVTAWIGEEPFETVRFDKKTNELTTKAPAPAEDPTPSPTPTASPTETPSPGATTPAPPATAEDAAADAAADATADAAAKVADPTANPAGSDLWLEEYSGTGSVSATLSIPEGYSLLVAGDGSEPAPSKITITWPLDNSTPWAGPLIVGGLVLLLVGLVSYLLALLHLRRSRRPRRNMPKGPRMPKLPRAPKPKTIKEVTGSGGGRRAIGRAPRVAVLPVILIGGLALSGCSADYWPTFGPEPTTSASASATATSDSTPEPIADEDIKPPAVTVPQLERIVRKIAVLAGDADKALNVDAIKTRFTGPALKLREANYKVRATLPDEPAPDAIPASPVVVTAPQQTDSWPRLVMTVIQNQDDPTTKPTALVMTQESPRANYLVRYAVSLTADATVPGLAPAVIGSPIVAPDSEFLLLPPNQVAAAYSDIILQGDKSQYYPLFDTESDPLLAQVGVATKEKRRADLPATAAIEFTNEPGEGLTFALATNDSGAVVTANIEETETVKPIDGGTVSPQNAAKAYSGVENSAKGVTQTYGDQILFYVPPAGSTEKIKLLGFSQGLVSASEVP